MPDARPAPARAGRAGLGLALALALGCAMPLDVRRVTDPAAEPEGVRFLVRRPGYRAFLWLEPLRPGERPGEICRFRLVLEQTLDGSPLAYEARGRASLLAATETTLTLDERGGLVSLSAGERDRAHEIAEAVAEIATSFAPLGVAAARRPGEPPPVCPDLPPDVDVALRDYVLAHRDLEARLDGIADAIAAKTVAVDEKTTSAGVRAIAALRELTAELEAELAAHRFRLAPEHFDVRLETAPGEARSVLAREAGTARAAAPWFVVTLRAEDPS